MQIVETLNEGLRRAFTITIPASEIDGKVDAQLKTMAPRVRMPGFRPGKVPANLVRKMQCVIRPGCKLIMEKGNKGPGGCRLAMGMCNNRETLNWVRSLAIRESRKDVAPLRIDP